MLQALVVGLGGFVGAVLRYGLSEWARRAHSGPFPAGTFLVNAIGCLLLGALMAAVAQRQLGGQAQLFLTTGILGALTTFSTFGYETFELLRQGQHRTAALSVCLNMAVGLAAVAVGYRSVLRA